jgi:hypothetical protein
MAVVANSLKHIFWPADKCGFGRDCQKGRSWVDGFDRVLVNSGTASRAWTSTKRRPPS